MFRQQFIACVPCRIEVIVNSRPMTIETISDIKSESDIKSDISLSLALTLLTEKLKVILTHTGGFSSADIYSRKLWRRVN